MDLKRKRVLVFNPNKTFIAIFSSNFQTARAFGMHTQSIHYACNGKVIASHGLYFRYEDESVEIEESDLGTLDLKEYDKMCGKEFKYYPNSKVTRYNLSTKQTKKTRNGHKSNQQV